MVSVIDEAVQPHARVVVTVETVVAGTPGATVEIGMDAGGGCDHPAGDVGDRVVIAAGAPGDSGIVWTSGALSPYNSATWIIRVDGTVASGPTLDGEAQTTLAGLVSTLRSMPNAAMAPPRGLSPWSVAGVGLLTTAILFLTSRRRRTAIDQ